MEEERKWISPIAKREAGVRETKIFIYVGRTDSRDGCRETGGDEGEEEEEEEEKEEEEEELLLHRRSYYNQRSQTEKKKEEEEERGEKH